MKILKTLGLLSMALASSVQAASYKVDFSTTGYRSLGGTTVSTEALAGSFVFEDDPAQNGFNEATLTSFSLNVMGVSYTANDVLLVPASGIEIHGLADGAQAAFLSDDIYISLVSNGSVNFTQGSFLFLRKGLFTPYVTTGFQFSVTAVPEAQVWVMAGAGLLVVAATVGRRRIG
ncbi:MAG: hypothetical protein EOP40_04960 [Rubrivivax sp.]|nr:MAG: hypothetical protein EOP40_04960 [Rubrivivax sp.]